MRMRGSEVDDSAEEASESKEVEATEKAEGTDKGNHSAHCDECAFGFSKAGMDQRPQEKAVQHAMNKGHTVHYINHKSGRAAAIMPKGHLSERKGY